MKDIAKTIKLAVSVLGAAGALCLIALQPIAGLSFQATAVLGILFMAIVWWVTGILPEFVTAVVMAALFVVVAGVSVESVFSTFSSSTWWILLSAFALGAGMKESGLMERIALAIVRKFPQAFHWQALAQLVVGTVIGPLIPSLAVKGAMLGPLVMELGDDLGYKRQGRRATGLFASMFVGIRTVAPTIVSASVTGYALMATLPADVQAQFNMVAWFVAALPWLAVVLVLNYFALVALYGPHRAGSSGDADEQARGVRSLGPFSATEKRMLAIILVTVAFWATEPIHQISAMVVGLFALAAMFVFKVIDSSVFKAGVNWSSLLFIGIALSLGSVFSEAGLSEWVMETCGPAFQVMAGNPYVLVLGIGVITVILRFLIVSEIAYLNLLMAFLVPMAASAQVNPWVLGFSAYALVIAWFVKYQSPAYLAAYYSIDGKMAKHSDMAKYCFVYIATCLIGLAVSVPYWQWMGLL